jgi:hypothetical protein
VEKTPHFFHSVENFFPQCGKLPGPGATDMNALLIQNALVVILDEKEIGA